MLLEVGNGGAVEDAEALLAIPLCSPLLIVYSRRTLTQEKKHREGDSDAVVVEGEKHDHRAEFLETARATVTSHFVTTIQSCKFFRNPSFEKYVSEK